MNPKFYALPKEKQRAILNAGFHVFSQNTYRKSPVSEIAEAAGISKALLFHYFQNKKELYLFLWDTCARITIEEMTKSGAYEQTDLFGSMDHGMQAKLRLMRQYPDIGVFAVRAFYEKDPEVSADIQRSMGQYLNTHAAKKAGKAGSGRLHSGHRSSDDVQGYVLGIRGMSVGIHPARCHGCECDGERLQSASWLLEEGLSAQGTGGIKR